MRRLLHAFSTFLALCAGLALFVFWLAALKDWLGGWGIVVAFALCPGLVVFPVIYWVVEDSFPWFYFVLWGVMVVAMVGGSLDRRGRKSPQDWLDLSP